MSYSKVCAYVPTTHGKTYCEIYYPARSELLQHAAQTCEQPATVLMVHGLGGSVDHFFESNLPVLLADNGHTVVCFDWYSHGKSTWLSSKKIKHNLDLFFSQLHDIIHCPQLPILKSNNFMAHGFSMGCFILLQYCVQFQPFECSKSNAGELAVNPKHAGPCLRKITLQSPWDGHFPLALRGLLYVPLLLRICKPSDMAQIKSIRTLKEILLWMDKGVNYSNSLDSFANLVLHGRSPTAAAGDPPAGNILQGEQKPLEPTSVRVQVDQIPSSCQVLLIVGTREPPFSITARRIARHIHRAERNKKTGSNANGKADQQASTGSIVQLKYCKYAGHMSFAQCAPDSYVKTFFQREIVNFVSGV